MEILIICVLLTFLVFQLLSFSKTSVLQEKAEEREE